MHGNVTKYMRNMTKSDGIIQPVVLQKYGMRVEANFCDIMHDECDKMITNTTNSTLFQKCYRRVKANSFQSVMKHDQIVYVSIKFIFSQKCGRRVKTNFI